MEKVLKIKDHAIAFRLNETADCWQAETVIDTIETGIEIDFRFHKEKEVDWPHFENFLGFINEKEGRLTQLIEDAKKLVNELGKAFYRNSPDAVSGWKMEFSNSILFNGKTLDGVVADGSYAYALVFEYSVRNGDRIEGDAYGLYLVDIENLVITGARRCQA